MDFEPFSQAGDLLFHSALVAERFSSIGDFVEAHAGEVLPAVSKVIARAHSYNAIEVYDAYARLEDYRGAAYEQLNKVDLLMVPTAGTIYTIEEVARDPITLNDNMGYYTYFANLLKLPVVAMPCGLRSDNLPFGVSFIGLPDSDDFLIEAVAQFKDKANTQTSVPRLEGESSLHAASLAS